MRLFVAIEIDKAIRRRIESVRDYLRKEGSVPKGSVKWVEPDNTHLTLNFLGETADTQVTEICRIVDETAKNHSAFELEIRGLGTFGSPARVAWVGITANCALTALQAELRDAFEMYGLAAENREYAGHLTLCRIKAPSAGYALQRKIAAMPPETYGMSLAESVCVFASELSKAGPVYTIVRQVELK